MYHLQPKYDTYLHLKKFIDDDEYTKLDKSYQICYWHVRNSNDESILVPLQNLFPKHRITFKQLSVTGEVEVVIDELSTGVKGIDHGVPYFNKLNKLDTVLQGISMEIYAWFADRQAGVP